MRDSQALEAEIDRLGQEIQRQARELAAYQVTTSASLAMEDTEAPLHAYIVRSTHSGIRNLERRLLERFNEGVAVGRALAEEEAEQSA